MAIYTTVTEQIESADENEISFRNLHTTMGIKLGNGTIRIPFKSIFRTYKNFFDEITVQAEFTPEEIVKYRKAPKILSYDLYGTTELWSALLEINNCISIIDFDFDDRHQPLVFDPTEFTPLMNEILILEEVLE